MVKVLYNGIDPFGTNGAPTPFVGISDQMINYGQRWGVAKNITLNGMITGSACVSGGYLSLLNSQTGIVGAFSQDFKPLVIQDGNTIALSGNYIRVNSLDFDKSPYFSTLNFKIDLTYYPPELFTGTYGVTAPVSTIKYTEQPDRTVNITRSISAKGFNTAVNGQNNALNNAINYVQSLTGTSNIIAPAFIPLFGASANPNAIGSSNILPRKISETVNRMDSTYSVNIDYTLRENAQTSTVLGYTVDISYDEQQGFYTVSFHGTLNGTQSESIDKLRQEFGLLNVYQLTYYIFNNATGYTSLNPNPQSVSVNENEQDNLIDFSYTYTTDPQTVKFDYTVTLDGDNLSDKTTVDFNGTLTAKGPQSLRLAQLEAQLANLDVINLCKIAYNTNANSPAVMNPIPKKYNIKRNLTNNNNSYNISASFDNSPIPPIAALKAFTWSIDVTPSLFAYYPIQFLNGDNGLFNMNYYKRGKISIKGSAIAVDNSDYSQQILSQALNIFNNYAASFSNRVRVESKVTRDQFADESGYKYSFVLTDTCETPIFS
jgi:hypothetical protein